MSEQAILQTKNVTIRFGGVIAVSDLNLNIKKGELAALIGPNGAGKTTAFNIITGVYEPSEGQVLLKGADITGMRPDKITHAGIARTFQNIRLFKNLTVLDNIMIGSHLRVDYNFLAATFKTPKARKSEKESMDYADFLLDKFDLYSERKEIASSLPYGKQRRLEIIRALATHPELLLLDEPAAGMNPRETAELTQLIFNMREHFDFTVLMIEHHMDLVMEIADHIYVLDFGKTIAEGDAKEIQNNERVIEAYLGVEDA